MKSILRWLANYKLWLTSYPMTYEGYAFTDVVSGSDVHYYRDRHGQRWLAAGRWSQFRVKCNEPARKGEQL